MPKKKTLSDLEVAKLAVRDLLDLAMGRLAEIDVSELSPKDTVLFLKEGIAGLNAIAKLEAGFVETDRPQPVQLVIQGVLPPSDGTNDKDP